MTLINLTGRTAYICDESGSLVEIIHPAPGLPVPTTAVVAVTPENPVSSQSAIAQFEHGPAPITESAVMTLDLPEYDQHRSESGRPAFLLVNHDVLVAHPSRTDLLALGPATTVLAGARGQHSIPANIGVTRTWYATSVR